MGSNQVAMRVSQCVAKTVHQFMELLSNRTKFFGTLDSAGAPLPGTDNINNEIGYDGSELGSNLCVATKIPQHFEVIGFEVIDNFGQQIVCLIINVGVGSITARRLRCPSALLFNIGKVVNNQTCIIGRFTLRLWMLF